MPCALVKMRINFRPKKITVIGLKVGGSQKVLFYGKRQLKIAYPLNVEKRKNIVLLCISTSSLMYVCVHADMRPKCILSACLK